MGEITVNFNNTVCDVKYYEYPNGRIRIQLIEKATGMPYANATLNDASKDKRIDMSYVFIKDYSENKGIYQALLNSKIIFPYKGRFDVGMNQALVCKLNAILAVEIINKNAGK